MTGTTTAVLTVAVLGSGEQLQFGPVRTLVAGYTGRDETAVRHHIDELSAIGVAPPPQVPMLYPVEHTTVTTSAYISVTGAETSGEIEPVILRHRGRFFLGVGSDHTDRRLETIDIAESKRACPKPLGATVVEIPDWAVFDWDCCRARSWVDGQLYQDGTLAGLRTPQNLLPIVAARLGDNGEDLICFAGTLPLLDGAFTPGARWDLELTLPGGRTLAHTYSTEGHRNMRTGSDYLASLDDGRVVLVDGEKIDDVSTHPAFAPVAHTIAELFDLAADPAHNMQYTAPETGSVANRVFGIPRSAEELRLRREAVETWARHTHGWVGRSPDHVGTFLASFAAHPEVFAAGERDFSENVTAFHQRVLEENLYVSYAIIPPQVSRATTASGWEGEYLQVGVVEQTEAGITVRGSQMLATGAAIADEILVSCIKPLGPDDQDFAVSFVVPVAAEGLKLYCRRPYAPAATSTFDYPLTTRYDEPDALVVFDDVLIPWERVFVNRDIAGVRKQFFDTGAHILGNWQAQIRFATKLRFIAGVARRVTQVNGVDKIPSVQEKLGELAALVSSVESAVLAAEYTAEPDDAGQWLPGRRALYGAMGLQSETYPRVLSILRDLVGGGVLQLPSSVRDLTSPLTARDIEHYVQSPGVGSEERIKLFKLAWDIIGSEFAGRHQQYEMFYAGAPFVVKGAYTYRNYGYDATLAEVEKFLGSYKLESA